MLDYKKLMEKANEMRKTSYVPYSHFRVGAVLVTKDGKEYTGCNFENASFPATVCAERTAFAKAISEGEREFACIAIVGGREGEISPFCAPCGVCRQVMSEFCTGDFKILCAGEEEVKTFTLSELLPERFGSEVLK